ncbi:MAG: ABC transporter substrate-binding protein [Acidobacteria bacterium]|nr:ABC transporter substrate-binding protein [Acidobacteriota bacterium]
MSDWRGSWSRREFVSGLTVGGIAGLLTVRPEPVAAEPPPETTRLRLIQAPSICQAAQFVAEEFFRAEGFTDLEYIRKPGVKGIETALASGEASINMHFNARLLMEIEAGDPVVILAGGHSGCFELFGTDRVRAIRDLKGKTVGVLELASSQHAFISSMAAYVGLDPQRDINWVTQPPGHSMQQIVDGKIDAFLGFPPQPQELRAMLQAQNVKSVHVVVNSMVDRPWSQYFCCMVAGNREFVRRHPVAVKRTLRAIFQASDLIAHEPERTARFLVDRGFTKNYDYALQALREMKMAFTAWREYDPEDTLRFWALRLHEAGFIKSSPQKIIAQGTDWRFLKELKKEVKG